MTRRIALAILLTVWGIVIAGCVTAYLTVRWALVEQLDQAMVAGASAIPELARPAAAVVRGVTPREDPTSLRPDRYVIRTENGQTVSPPGGGQASARVQVESAVFQSQGQGTRVRSLTLRAAVRGADGRELPVTITYQASADQLDGLLNWLAWAFGAFGIGAGLVTALVAVRVSRAALRPLHATADVIGTIDEHNLHRRIDASRLPPELAPMAQRLNEMLERIEGAYEQRQRFLADASHELRTPVAALVTTVEVALRHPREAESYRRTLETCLSDARLLRHLVEKLMEQCRADSLSHDEPVVEIDAAPLLQQCAAQAAALGESRQVRVEVKVPSPLVLETQPDRLRSIVVNLLSNAVEYNREGGQVVLVAQPNGQCLHLTIRDTGIGIEAEHLPHVFEPFYRADAARAVPAGHLGLGLSLVHAHVAALGGTVQVQSAPGVGTQFSLELPIRRQER